MTTENSVPQSSLELIIPEKPLRERLTPSDAQQVIIQETALQYMKRNRIDFSRPNLEAALAVIGVDCVYRGLLLNDKTELLPQDNVGRLIKTGLDSREQVRTLATEGISDLDQAYREDGSLIGSVAISRISFDRVRRELRRFPLAADVSESESFAVQVETRRQLIPKIAGLVVEALPHENFPDASLEQFPTLTDQSKIIRNMFVSLALRGTPIPALSVEEVQRLANDKDAIEQLLSEELVEKVSRTMAERLDLPPDIIQDFLHDLLIQTRETFLEFTKKPSHIPAKGEYLFGERDRTYKVLSNALLLLHPALEEKPLITSPSRIVAGEDSLWDEEASIVIGNKRIPRPEILSRAARLESARGYGGERFHAGLQAWHDYRYPHLREQKKIDVLEKEIHEYDEELVRLGEGTAQIPTRITAAAETYGDQERSLVEIRRMHIARQRVIDQAKEILEYRQQYIDSIVDEEGNLPDETTVPAQIYKERLRDRNRHVASAERSAQRISLAAERVIQEDVIYFQDLIANGNAPDLMHASADEVKGYTDTLQRQLLTFRRDGLTQEAAELIQRNIVDIRNFATNYLFIFRLRYYSQGHVPLKGDAERLAGLGELNQKLHKRGFNERDAGEFAKMFYEFSIKNRLEAFRSMEAAKRRAEEMQNLPDVSDQWTKEDVEQWSKEIDTATAPIDSYSTEELRRSFNQLEDWNIGVLRTGVKITLPAIIPAPQDFRRWLENRIMKRESNIEDTQRIGQTNTTAFRRREWMIDALRGLKKLIDNPLFPLKEAEGIPGSVFWQNFNKRLYLIKAILGIELLEEEVENAEQVLSERERQLYERFLSNKKRAAEIELRHLKNDEPAKTKLLSKMTELDLALEAQ